MVVLRTSAHPLECGRASCDAMGKDGAAGQLEWGVTGYMERLVGWWLALHWAGHGGDKPGIGMQLAWWDRALQHHVQAIGPCQISAGSCMRAPHSYLNWVNIDLPSIRRRQVPFIIGGANPQAGPFR